MNLLWVYLAGVGVLAVVVGAFAFPASANHKGHPADDPMLAMFLPFIWPVGVVVILVGLPLFALGAVGAEVGSVVKRVLGSARGGTTT